MKMKLFIMALLAAGLFVVACDKKGGEDKKEGENKENAEGGEDAAKAEPSHVEFHATKGAGAGGHDGKFFLKSGELTGEAGKITGGTLVFDLNSLEITDAQPLPADKADQLKGHLMAADFFNVEKNGADVTFEITSVEDGKAMGKLTLGGTTKDIELTLTENKVDEASVNGAGTSIKGNTTIKLSDFGVNNFEKDGKKPVDDEVKVDFVYSGK